MAKRKTKFEKFAEKCEHFDEDYDYEPPINSGEPGDGGHGNRYLDCTHPKRTKERMPQCDRYECPLRWERPWETNRKQKETGGRR